jgi:hypothetical protein
VIRSSAAITSLAAALPRLPWTSTFSVAPTSASRCLNSGSIESSRAFACSFKVRRTPLNSSPISRLSFAWPRRKGSGADSASLESLAGSRENARGLVLRRARSRGVAPGRELELPPGRRTATQVFEKLLIVSEDDDLPVGEAVSKKFGKPPAVLDIKTVDHIVEHQEAELFVEGLRHGQKE